MQVRSKSFASDDLETTKSASLAGNCLKIESNWLKAENRSGKYRFP